MKTKKKIILAAISVASLGGFAVTLVQATTPELDIQMISTNQVRITIINPDAGAAYQIFRTPVLADPAYPWLLYTLGTTGQTNFVFDMSPDNYGFFQASGNLDWDGDGIPNWQDAQPTNSGVGNLVITIDYPTTGTLIQ